RPSARAAVAHARPPCSVSACWAAKLADHPRWKYGTPPAGHANFAWVQHFIYHLSPKGTAGFVLANGALSSQQSGEGEIRKKLLEADIVDAIVALPTETFYKSGISG